MWYSFPCLRCLPELFTTLLIVWFSSSWPTLCHCLPFKISVPSILVVTICYRYLQACHILTSLKLVMDISSIRRGAGLPGREY
ncbi:hypothetical protein EDB85DRAFT_2033532 [Lactarius pseudohatsudake]|nr:hypothetical protein EDB85DRAFT_2033532 [Lactarius pseudohatsudake]